MTLNDPDFNVTPLLSHRSRTRERLYATGLSIRLSVYLSVCRQNLYKNAILSTSKPPRSMVSIDHLHEVLHGLFK